MDTSVVSLEALATWMDGQGLAAGPIVEVEPLTGGTQNILLAFTKGGQRFVLRHPPPHKRANSDETMRREARVLGALANTNVPHPRLLAACGDTTVLGSAFYLMEQVDGVNPTVALPAPYLESTGWRHQFGLDIAVTAATIGAVDYERLGLGNLGRAEGYLERQVDRWRSQLDSYSQMAGYSGPEIPGVARVGEWLDANQPSVWTPGLIHGDFHLANILCSPHAPRVAAAIDWELTTIGDPLIDLGWLLATWPEPGYDKGVSIEPWEGFPSAPELVETYAQHTNRDMSAVVWYEVLACYKLGILLEGTYARSMSGAAPKAVGEVLHQKTLDLFARAERRINNAE